tara:strand:+ start:480 stop:635 length:156 start_codon:yes stop_codon:yes gene_type:complete
MAMTEIKEIKKRIQQKLRHTLKKNEKKEKENVTKEQQRKTKSMNNSNEDLK